MQIQGVLRKMEKPKAGPIQYLTLIFEGDF